MEQKLEVLRQVFGYPSFRPGQEELMDALLSRRDAVGIMPTGAGKSLCYQIPALLFPGLTLVVSPLISLMKDQVGALVQNGIRGAYLNSSLTYRQYRAALRNARNGVYKIIYVAPERLLTPEFLDFAQNAPISMVTVDEAHCVSQWGQDFRPSYLTIPEFLGKLPSRPVVSAFTATATPKVREDILSLLDLQDPFVSVTSFDRPNLSFQVLRPKSKLPQLLSLLKERRGQSGIVYCATRKGVEEVCAALRERGFSATRYHAGLSDGERQENQEDFLYDRAPVMVATNAFGMGIDKSNVRYVVHHNMPGSIEAYYQEAGRAGRDGEPSECLLFWSDGDVSTCRFFIEQESGNEELSPEEADAVRASRRRLLEAMCGYCLTTGCLRQYILDYFGEKNSQVVRNVGDGASGAEERGENPMSDKLAACPETNFAPERVRCAEGFETHGSVPKTSAAAVSSVGCQADGAVGEARDSAPEALAVSPSSAGRRTGDICCSNCAGDFEAVDVTDVARATMRCVKELRGRFGKGMVVDVLRGSKSAKLLDMRLDEAASYGAVDVPAAQAKEVIELLAAGGYLTITEGSYPTVGLGPRAREAAEPGFSLSMKRVARKPERVRAGAGHVFGGSGAKEAAEADPALFERLRALRKRLADEAGVPPYIVFSDAALRDMCAKLPATDDEFLEVSGVGATKLARYGEAFLAEIAAHLREAGAVAR